MLGEQSFQPYAINTFSHRGKNFEEITPIHYVRPHEVRPYSRRDGTFVSGYWRDGDGDTTCYLICNKTEGFDCFLYWILAGCPFGIRRMFLWLIPKNFGISGSIGVLALNCIAGGLIGGIVLIFKIISIVVEVIRIVSGNFWTKSPKEEI